MAGIQLSVRLEAYVPVGVKAAHVNEHAREECLRHHSWQRILHFGIVSGRQIEEALVYIDVLFRHWHWRILARKNSRRGGT